MRSIVVAYTERERAIGRENSLPWAGRLPADMAHFKELTEGQAVIMGRRTFESLPESYRPLPRRQNIVLSLSNVAFNGVQMARSLEEAYALAEAEPMVIGGARIYEQALATVDRVYATEIDASVPDADAFFPPLPVEEWRRDNIVAAHQADGRNKYNYAFVTYFRKNRIEL